MIPESYGIERVEVSALTAFSGNPRTHSDTQIDQIAASIREFGWTNPILVDAEGTIIAGHGRLAAATRLGLTEVPVIRLGHLSDAQRKALVIADNQLALNAGWDEAALSDLIRELDTEKFDLDLLGFVSEELDRYLASFAEDSAAVAEEGDLPEVPVVPTSRPGDLWVLGNHRLLCGDATVVTDVERLMDRQLADMAALDPPYNVDYANAAKNKSLAKDRRILNDALGEGFYQFLYDTCVNLLMVTKGACYVCMSSSELHTLQKAFTDAGGKWSTFIIWAKNTFTLGRADYQRQYEPILYGWKQGADHFWCGARDQGDVWFVDKPRVNDLHPTMKPVELIERAIRNSSKSRDIVLDLFGGSGTTLIAAERTGRSARLLELDPKYVDVIVERWQNLTGQAAVLDGEDRTYDDLKAARAKHATGAVSGG
ncbi:DNA methylase N-4 [Aestuariivirga litoralis]|uniref:Methyltransferase n=1 Tax=Aestuariivirga litoralis TaxID=2650924 RepID=A0A2W2AS19_9HYPH|nr:site-specific DNA-methyltransferase [Aestuariivirga litoralis]PZF78121.1 DNA methylase N-4 [Aestuariivirga litoralis]